MEIAITIVSIILVLVGIVGTVLPMLPGLFLCLSGLLLYKFFGNGSELHQAYIWVFSTITILSALLEYIIPITIAKKYGGTKWGSLGGIVGTFLGLLSPIPFGFLLGMFLGVLTGELIHDAKDTKKAINSMKGSIKGFFYSSIFNLLIGFSMLMTILINLISKLF